MTLSKKNYDVVVIGSGPGGEGASMQAAKAGLKVAVIERYPLLGGNCTHLGTIPSKTLRHVAYRLAISYKDSLLSQFIDPGRITFSDLLERAKDVISKQVQLRSGHYSRNEIDVIFGRARFLDQNTIEVSRPRNQKEIIKAKNIIIAAGSRPYRPKGVDFDDPRIFDSDSILTLDSKPNVITVYGAGVIGCEYTSIFRTLGRKINLINTRDKLLSFLDDEIVDALSYHLRDQGVLVKHNESYENIEASNDEVVLHLKSGKKVKSDILLFALGRTGNTDGLGLEDINLPVNLRGNIEVNEHYQTSIPHIYAVGDIVGFPALASAAYDQGRFAVRHITDHECADKLVEDIPVGIYTSPEISCIGKTETELTEAKIPYEVGHASFRHLARAQITGQTAGMLKILFHCQTLEILGIHCFGQNASEIIHIGQAIMAQPKGKNTIKFFIDTTFNYPTMAEAYRVAALNGMNRLFEADPT